MTRSIPVEVYVAVRQRDGGFTKANCVGPFVEMPGECWWGTAELDHVRASGGLGLKSPSTADNLVSLCRNHHRMKTEDGRRWRPVLLDYIERAEAWRKENSGGMDSG